MVIIVPIYAYKRRLSYGTYELYLNCSNAFSSFHNNSALNKKFLVYKTQIFCNNTGG